MTAQELAPFLLVCTLALAFAEYQVRRRATLRWLLLAVVWLVVVGLLLWVMGLQ